MRTHGRPGASTDLVAHPHGGPGLGTADRCARGCRPSVGRRVTFSTRGQVLCSAVSNSVGIAACYPDALGLLAVIQNGSVPTYAGNVTYQPSTGSANLL